jgi:superfamily II DNA or RNA helicase
MAGDVALTDDDLWAWQSSALASWRAASAQGIIEAVTGTGKTRVGVHAIRSALLSDRPTLVLVPTTALLRQWARVLSDELPPETRIGLLGDGRVASLRGCDVLVATVQSASRRRPSPPSGAPGGLLVADECHRLGARTFAEALHRGFDQRLGLTATLERPDDGVQEQLLPYFGQVVHTYGFREALADEVIAPFRIATLGVELTPPERDTYEENREKASAARKQLISRFGLPASPFGEFLAEVTVASSGSFASPLTRTARRYLGAFHAYREVLATTAQKLAVVPHLAPALRLAGGTLLFGESVAAVLRMADDLTANDVSVEALHGGLSSRVRQDALRRFETRELQAIAAPRVLDEGIDVPEADLAVIVAASQSRRQMIQRLGRVVRRKEDGRPARMVIMYVRGTTEDPATGGHEAFLDLVLDVAQERKDFSAHEVDALLSYLEAGVDTVPIEPEPTGWWDAWSTNAPELGLSLSMPDDDLPHASATAAAASDDDVWWRKARTGSWRELVPRPRDRELPQWMELRISRPAEVHEVRRLVDRFRHSVRDLAAAEAHRLEELPIIQHLAAHPAPVADALLELEVDRIEEELEAEVAAPIRPGRVRVRYRRDPHVLSEPRMNNLWQI